METIMVALQRVHHRITTWYIYIPKGMESGARPMPVRPCSGSIIHNNHNAETTQMSASRWRDELNVIHTYNRILFNLPKNGILMHIITWMNLENTMLSEIRQSQEDKYRPIPLTGGTENRQIQRDGKQNRGYGEGGIRSSCSMGTKFLFGMTKLSRNVQWWWLHNIVDLFNVTELYTWTWLKW